MEREYTVHFHKGKKVKVYADSIITDNCNLLYLYLNGNKVFISNEYNIKFITIK